MIDYYFTCGNYSNWNLLTNFLFNYCALQQNDLLFPVRFILDRTLNLSYKESNDTYNLDFRFKNKPEILFDPTLFKFIGCIPKCSIKSLNIISVPTVFIP